MAGKSASSCAPRAAPSASHKCVRAKIWRAVKGRAAHSRSKPICRVRRARAGAGGLRLFINGRAVRDRALAVTIAQAYGSVLERGRYPRSVVFLDLPSEFLDVNVHPQKAEVRFADPRATADALYGTLSRALAGAFSLPT